MGRALGLPARRDEAQSQRRADSVRRYLITKGVHADRLVAKGYGETVPAATNRNESGRSINRRVEFHIVE